VDAVRKSQQLLANVVDCSADGLLELGGIHGLNTNPRRLRCAPRSGANRIGG
jgi:hypothetical protein